MNTFDRILENRVLMGKFQYSMLFAVGCMHFLAASEIVIQQILLSALRREWDLSAQQVIFLPFINYWGLFIGALTCSFFADKTGRKNMLFIFSIIQVISLIWNANVTSYANLIVIFFIYGSIYGIVGPISNILLTEVSPEQYRGKMVIMQQIQMVSGLVSATLLLFVFMEDFGNGNWQGFIYVHAIISLFASFFLFILVRESPKFYICSGSFKLGFDSLNKIGQFNDVKYESLTDHEKNQIVNWQNQLQAKNQQKAGVGSLFTKEQRSLTIRIWILFALFEFHRSIQALMPLYFYNYKKGFSAMLVPYSAELLGIGIIYFFIGDNKQGRDKKILIGVLALMIGVVLLTLLIRDPTMIVILFAFNRPTQRVQLACLYIIGTKSFSVLQASIGLGTSLAVGRVSGTFIQYLLIYAMYIEDYLPFILLVLASVVMIIIVLTL